MGKSTKDRKLVIRGREISEADIGLICNLTRQHGKQGRSYISRKLYEFWRWNQPNGMLKDRACRSIRQLLSERGLIQDKSIQQGIPKPEKSRYKNLLIGIPGEICLLSITKPIFTNISIKQSLFLHF